MPEPRPVVVPIPIRWSDLDALGHVNNAVYLSYLEVARLSYIRAAMGEDAELDRSTWLPRDFQFILGEVRIRYLSPAVLTDRLEASLYVSKVGRKSFVFEYRILEVTSDRLIAEACSTQVWYDYAAAQSRPVPEEAISRMEALQGAPIRRGSNND